MPPTRNGHWKAIRIPFLTGIGMSFLLLQLLFLGNLSYLYGTQFRASERSQGVNVLMVDYDGGVVGQSLVGAYQALKSPGFITLDQHPPQEYPSAGDLRKAVCKGDYWAAVYSNAGASTRLSSALDNEAAAANYQNADAVSYIWNEARYSAETESVIKSGMQELLAAARAVYYKINGTSVVQSANTSNAAVLEVFTDPIEATANNIQPTTQGTRVLYNTVTMILPIIQQFFFMMALNGISAQFHILSQLGPHWNGAMRATLSTLYTLLGALCTTGYIWGFKEDWAVNGNQFVLTWMVFWLYMQINFLIFDVMTAYLPMPAMPFCVLTWAIVNVASTITPFEMNPGFYRWGYALPAHEAYQLLVQIWSGGCARQDYQALPILFAWWIVGNAMAIIATQHRCAVAEKARLLEEAKEDDLRTATSSEKEPEAALEQPETDPEAALTPASDSVRDNVAPLRRRTQSLPSAPLAYRRTRSQSQVYELMRLERQAYGPSYPTPFVHGISRS